MGDENLLRGYTNFSKNKNAVEMASIMKDLKNAVFGYLLPSQLEDDIDSIDIRDKSPSESEKLDIAQGEIDTSGMPPLESEKDAEKRQKGKGLKTITPKQMITRLPILLSQLQAGNNSQKLKDEVRQNIYSLYR